MMRNFNFHLRIVDSKATLNNIGLMTFHISLFHASLYGKCFPLPKTTALLFIYSFHHKPPLDNAPSKIDWVCRDNMVNNNVYLPKLFFRTHIQELLENQYDSTITHVVYKFYFTWNRIFACPIRFPKKIWYWYSKWALESETGFHFCHWKTGAFYQNNN